MANKRNLKKAIKAACGDLAGECLIARDLVPGIDRKKMTDIFFDIADLQYVSIDNVSFSFDKTEKSFDSRHEYKKARAKYYKTAYKKLNDYFKKGVNDIIARMNSSLGEQQKAANKARAEK